MSVIFNTLRKLEHPSFEENGRGTKLKKRRGVYSFRRMFLSPSVALLIALFIFLAGFCAIYGIGRFRNYIAAKGGGSALSKKGSDGSLKKGVQKETGKPREAEAKKEYSVAENLLTST